MRSVFMGEQARALTVLIALASSLRAEATTRVLKQRKGRRRRDFLAKQRMKSMYGYPVETSSKRME